MQPCRYHQPGGSAVAALPQLAELSWQIPDLVRHLSSKFQVHHFSFCYSSYMLLSVIVPVFNEEEIVAETYRVLEEELKDI